MGPPLKNAVPDGSNCQLTSDRLHQHINLPMMGVQGFVQNLRFLCFIVFPPRKIELLETIRPQYIILKPSLHGGISGSEEWMELAAERGIGSWVTSALESNIGLNAIAQWCATLQPALPQGLGTGLLFTDNIDYPLHIEGDCLWFHPEEQEPDLLNWLKQ